MTTTRSAIAAHLRLEGGCSERDGCATAQVYSSVETEYRAIRERVGLQDLSHFGRTAISGEAALDLINHLVLTDVARLPVHQIQPSLMLDDEARPVCDLQIANFGTHYLLLSEGMPPAQVRARLHAAAADFPGVAIEDRAAAIGLLSVDGPYAWELLKTFVGLGIIGTRYLEIVPDQSIGEVEVTLCRAGKTGEYGYLLICPQDRLVALWDTLCAAGERFDMLPVGMQASDLCRIENRTLDYRREGAAAAHVFELNTRTMLGRDKADYVGRAAIEAAIENGVARRLIGMTLDAALPPEAAEIAPGAAVHLAARPIGTLVNAAYSFGLQRWIALALIEARFACVGIDYDIRTESGAHPARTVSAPFLFNKSLTVRPQEESYFD